MVTGASTRNGSPAKSGAKPEPAAQKSAARKTTTDLISPKTKKPATENKPATDDRPARKGGVPPISKAKPKEPAPAKSEPERATPPPKPETVSLIEEKRTKKPETTVSSETRSVLPPISKIRAPKPPVIAASKPPVTPEPETVKAPTKPPETAAPEPPAGGRKAGHLEPAVVVCAL